jgi:hypothetical protein
MKKLFSILALCVLLFGCPKTTSVADSLNLIVAGVEAALPSIPNLTAADDTAADNYLSGILSVTDMFLAGPINAQSTATAVNGYLKLAPPVISNSEEAKLITTVANAVTAFLNVYEGAVVTVAPPAPASSFAAQQKKVKAATIKLSASDQKKIADMRARIAKAQSKLIWQSIPIGPSITCRPGDPCISTR